MRLNRFLAQSGITSRRRADDLIRTGRVHVNGRAVTQLGSQVDPTLDRITLDGKLVGPAPSLVYLLLNKPRGYLVSASDSRGRKTVFELVEGVPHRLFSVGRLDYDTEGALLLTNDGELAHRLTHPRYEVKKVYQAWVRGVPDGDDLDKLRQGVQLDDGVTSPARVDLRQAKADKALVEIEIHEGKKRQVKRMLEAIGHPVEGLSRVAFGGIKLGDLSHGDWRYLGAEEVEWLRGEAGLIR